MRHETVRTRGIGGNLKMRLDSGGNLSLDGTLTQNAW